MYDVFFISYEEPNADDNFARLKSTIKIAKRIHGISGISNAHRACAERSLTRMFWTIDGDTVADEGFVFDYKPSIYDENYLHIWYSRNPVNNLTYGYGAIKLWPRSAVLEFDKNWLDFTTTVGNIKIMPSVVATTYFNTGPYDSWKSAFRECIKLCYNIQRDNDSESTTRLLEWINSNTQAAYAENAVQGARDALQFYVENKDNPAALQLINDFTWLKKFYSDIGIRVTDPNFDATQYLSRL